MSQSAFRFSFLVSGLLLTILSTSSALAGEINPYSVEAQTLFESELDINDSGKATSETGPVGNYNFSPSAAALMNGSTEDCRTQKEAFTDQDLLISGIGEDTLLSEMQAADVPAVKSESDIATEDFNFPVPEPGSLAIWILLGITGGLIIRRRARSK